MEIKKLDSLTKKDIEKFENFNLKTNYQEFHDYFSPAQETSESESSFEGNSNS